MRLKLARLISWSGLRSWRTEELSRNFSRAERGGKVADNTPTLYSNYKSDTCTDVWIKWEIREIWQTKCEYHWPSGYYGYHLVAMVTRYYQYLQTGTHSLTRRARGGNFSNSCIFMPHGNDGKQRNYSNYPKAEVMAVERVEASLPYYSRQSDVWYNIVLNELCGV